MKANIGTIDRSLRMIAGLLLIGLSLSGVTLLAWNRSYYSRSCSRILSSS